MLAQGPSRPGPGGWRKDRGRAKKWTPPHTSWGEPDLQGVWSYATITPLERPENQAGKEVLSDEEVAAADREARTGADRRDGSPEADLARAYNAFWYDRGKSDGRTSLIVDPPDGRLPSLTPEGQSGKRAAAAELACAHPFDSVEDRPLQERCIIYHGVPPLPSGYNNTYQIFQTPGYVAIVDENIHDVRGIPLDGRPHVGREHPSVERKLARPLGGRHAGRRDDQLQSQDHLQIPGGHRDVARGRALHARRRRQDRLPLHHQRSDDIHEALDGGASHDEPARLRHL